MEGIPVEDATGGGLVGFVLSEATVTGIPVSIFSGEPEVSVREEELMLVCDEEHPGTPLILGVLRRLSRLEPYLRRRVKVGIEEYPDAIDRIEKLSYTNVVLIPLAEIQVSDGNIVGISRNVTYVPFPGSKVYRVGRGSIIAYLLRETIAAGEPIIVGSHKYSLDVQIPLDPSYVQYHIGVFGATGMGKSRLVKVLVDEIVQKTEYAVIVFDHTGMDYAPFYPDTTINSLSIELGPLGIADFMVKRLRVNPQYYSTYLEVFGIEFRKKMGEFREKIAKTQGGINAVFSEIKALLKEVARRLGARPDTLNNLDYRMDYFIPPELLAKILLGRKHSAESIIDLARRCKERRAPLVIDLSFEETLEMKRTIVGDIIDGCWKWIFEHNFSEPNRKKYEPINIVIVIDEAQNYAWGSGFCKDQVERVAREGRKWRLGLIVASQRLARSIDPDIRANINTVFFSKLSQTTDLKEIQEFADISGIDMPSLSQLMPREFYVAGLMNPLRKPIAIRVREVKDVM